MSSPAILVRDLKKYYGYKAAVDGVDLEVPRGSFFGFLGPNGAGKSTTIRILTGLIPFDRGSVEVLGFSLPGQELEMKRRIGGGGGACGGVAGLGCAVCRPRRSRRSGVSGRPRAARATLRRRPPGSV